MNLDRLQQAWQSQPDGTPEINPDRLLKAARRQRRVQFWCEILIVSIALYVGGSMSRTVFRDIQKNWPWLFVVASEAWVVGYVLFNQWRRRRDVVRNDEPLLARVEWSIQDIEDRMWLNRNSIWWCVLPLFLGLLTSVFIFGAMEYAKNPELLIPFTLLLTLGVFVATFYFCYRVMRYRWPSIEQQHRQELVKLRALRESLLNIEQ